MTALSLTYTLSNGTVADADNVMQDFNDVKDYINGHTIRQDGGVAMAAPLNLQGDPTGDNHAVRRYWTNGGGYAAARNSIMQSFTANVDTALRCNDEDYDLTNSYNMSTGIFTAPRTGLYHVCYGTGHNSADSYTITMRVIADGQAYTGTKFKVNTIDANGSVCLPMAATVRCSAGQTIYPAVNFDQTISRAVGTFVTIAFVHGV